MHFSVYYLASIVLFRIFCMWECFILKVPVLNIRSPDVATKKSWVAVEHRAIIFCLVNSTPQGEVPQNLSTTTAAGQELTRSPLPVVVTLRQLKTYGIFSS